MSTNQYPSRYSNGKTVSSAQYITELICENKAKKDKMDLHYRFWTNKIWASYYRNQIASANQLLQKYEAKAVIAALKDRDAEKIYSLRAPHLPAIIEKHQGLLENKNQDLTLNIDRNTNKTHRTDLVPTKKSSILSRLKELDNDS